MIQARNITKHYGDKVAVDAISFTVGTRPLRRAADRRDPLMRQPAHPHVQRTRTVTRDGRPS